MTAIKKTIRKQNVGSQQNNKTPKVHYLLRPMYDPTLPEIERLATDLVDWSKEETSLRLNDFAPTREIARSTFWAWVEKWPILKEAVEDARLTIAGRREIGGLTGKYNAGLISHSMYIYDKDWKEMYEWKAKLAKKEDDKPTTIVVQMPSIPQSNLVPEKKDEQS